MGTIRRLDMLQASCIECGIPIFPCSLSVRAFFIAVFVVLVLLQPCLQLYHIGFQRTATHSFVTYQVHSRRACHRRPSTPSSPPLSSPRFAALVGETISVNGRWPCPPPTHHRLRWRPKSWSRETTTHCRKMRNPRLRDQGSWCYEGTIPHDDDDDGQASETLSEKTRKRFSWQLSLRSVRTLIIDNFQRGLLKLKSSVPLPRSRTAFFWSAAHTHAHTHGAGRWHRNKSFPIVRTLSPKAEWQPTKKRKKKQKKWMKLRILCMVWHGQTAKSWEELKGKKQRTSKWDPGCRMKKTLNDHLGEWQKKQPFCCVCFAAHSIWLHRHPRQQWLSTRLLFQWSSLSHNDSVKRNILTNYCLWTNQKAWTNKCSMLPFQLPSLRTQSNSITPNKHTRKCFHTFPSMRKIFIDKKKNLHILRQSKPPIPPQQCYDRCEYHDNFWRSNVRRIQENHIEIVSQGPPANVIHALAPLVWWHSWPLWWISSHGLLVAVFSCLRGESKK